MSNIFSRFDIDMGKTIEKLRKREIGPQTGKPETQEELAAALGVKRETINHWESGTRKIKAENLAALATHFNVPAGFILGIQNSDKLDPEISMICDYTGLGRHTVEMLHYSSSDFARTFISYFLKQTELEIGEGTSTDDFVEYCITQAASNILLSKYKHLSVVNGYKTNVLSEFFIWQAMDTLQRVSLKVLRDCADRLAENLSMEVDGAPIKTTWLSLAEEIASDDDDGDE